MVSLFKLNCDKQRGITGCCTFARRLGGELGPELINGLLRCLLFGPSGLFLRHDGNKWRDRAFTGDGTGTRHLRVPEQ